MKKPRTQYRCGGCNGPIKVGDYGLMYCKKNNCFKVDGNISVLEVVS